jgi:hypothetical protein
MAPRTEGNAGDQIGKTNKNASQALLISPPPQFCSFKSICENCTRFATNKTFQPVLLRQLNHATRNGQTGRAQLFNTVIDRIDDTHP